MTLDKLKTKFMEFLNSSTVNLGRKNTKTRQLFLAAAADMLDEFDKINTDEGSAKKTKKKKTVKAAMSSSVMVIKPNNPTRALDVGKGVHSMTSSESMAADEQLNRSPFAGKTKKED